MVDHGASSHYVFLTIVGFQINARFGARRDVLCFSGALLPALLIRTFGIKQNRAVLEQVSPWVRRSRTLSRQGLGQSPDPPTA